MVVEVLAATVETPNDNIDCVCVDGAEAEAGVVLCWLNSVAVVVAEGAGVVMAADVDALVTVVVVAVVAAADDDDGTTVKLKPPAEEAGAGTENNDPDVAGEAVAADGVDALVAEAEANAGAEAEDEPNGKLREVADELAAALVLENNEEAGAAGEVAKEKPVDGADAGVVGAAELLFVKEKAGAEDAEENKAGAVLAVVVVADDGVKPNDGAEAAVAGDDEKPKDAVVVAVVAGDEAVVVLKSGAEVVDPNSAEPVPAPNPRAGEEAEVVVVLDAAAPVFNPKPKDGVEAAAVAAVVVPDAAEPKPKPVAAPEKRLGAEAADAAAPNRPGAAAAAEVAPKGLGAVAAEEAPPNKLGVVAGEEVAPPKMLGVDAADDAAPNTLGVVAVAGVEDAKMDGADAAAAVDWPNEKPVDPKPNGDGDEEVAGAAAEAAGADPNREEPKVGAAAEEEEEKREEPKAGAEAGAGEEAAAAAAAG